MRDRFFLLCLIVAAVAVWAFALTHDWADQEHPPTTTTSSTVTTTEDSTTTSTEEETTTTSTTVITTTTGDLNQILSEWINDNRYVVKDYGDTMGRLSVAFAADDEEAIYLECRIIKNVMPTARSNGLPSPLTNYEDGLNSLETMADECLATNLSSAKTHLATAKDQLSEAFRLTGYTTAA